MNAASRLGALGRWLLGSRHRVAAIAQTIATRFLLAALNLGTGIITARGLGPTGRGEQAAMTLWPMLVPYLLSLGLPSALRFCVPRQPGRQSELYSLALVAASALSVVAIAIGELFMPVWLHQYPPNVVRDAQVCMFFAAEVMLNLIQIAMLEAIGNFKLANSMRLISTVMTFLALCVLALGHVITPFATALAYLAPPVVAFVWALWALRSCFALPSPQTWGGLRILASYGFRSYGVDILTTLSTQVDQVLVVGFLSATAMGVYMVALSASRVLQILHTAVVTVVFPSAAGLEPERVVPMVARAARVSTLIAIVFGLALALALPVLVPLFYGRGFDGAVHVAQVLTLEAVIGGLTFVLSQAFMAGGRPGLVTALQGFGFLIALPCMLVLLPRLGLIGAAISLLIATTARLCFVLGSFPLILHTPVPNLLPSEGDFAIFRRVLASGRD